ncbi:MAG: hypothetical protein ACE5J3_06920 [Methanosarcinales archaeon]
MYILTMRINIKKKGTAILISFDTKPEKFESASERNRFFWELHGRKQTVTKNSGTYKYYREGLLDVIPHIKVDNSVFIIAMQHLKEMMEFFEEWEDKLELKTFPVLLDNKDLKKLEREVEIE